MYSITLTVTLTLEGPILTKSTSIGGYGLDAVMAKNHNGEYYLPGTLVKGRLLQAWQELSAIIADEHKSLLNLDISLSNFSDAWLGKESGNSDNNKAIVNPKRARLIISDFACIKSDTDKSLHRIKIDEVRGSVKKGALLVMEAPFAVGEHIEFKGDITFTARDNSEINNVIKCLEIGLKWCPAFGSEKTVGFGKLIEVQIHESKEEIINIPAKHVAAGNELIDIIIKPNSPFCFARRQVTRNLFESEHIIPGGAIKGAFVNTWAGMLGKSRIIEVDSDFDTSRKELSEQFDKIRFTHAFPVQNSQNERSVVAPLSLVKVKKKDINDENKEIEAYYDVAFHKDAILIDDFPYAPAFTIDWKDYSDVEKIFGWDKMPDRELRIRTAIDKEKRNAKEKELFAYEMVIPRGFKWISRIDLSRINNANMVKVESQLLEILSFGLTGMSKTKTSAEVEFSHSELKSKIESKCEPIDRNGNKYWVITLQTSAILCNPSTLSEASTDKNLFDEYAVVWKQISAETLELSHFFATQSLAGGYYLYKRFQNGKPYNPYLLTDAGSVFVLISSKGNETEAQKKIEEWFKKGLDFPNWAKEKYSRNGKDGSHWTNCPYIPENGFGEIAVNLHESYPKEIKVYE